MNFVCENLAFCTVLGSAPNPRVTAKEMGKERKKTLYELDYVLRSFLIQSHVILPKTWEVGLGDWSSKRPRQMPKVTHLGRGRGRFKSRSIPGRPC